MNFRYENNRVYLTDTNGTNIEQPFWENTYKAFTDYEDAKNWVINYLSKNLDTSIIYFDIDLKYNDTIVEENVLSVDKLYKVVLKESTSQLIGEYDIKVTIKRQNNDVIELIKKVTFIDGEGSFDIIFNEQGLMEIHLENIFKIGSQNYVFINDTTEMPIEVLSMLNKNQLVYIIE